VSVLGGVALLIAHVRKYRRDPAGSRVWELPLRTLATAGGPPAALAASSSSSKASGAKRRKRR
jgi:hypothetical protein